MTKNANAHHEHVWLPSGPREACTCGCWRMPEPAPRFEPRDPAMIGLIEVGGGSSERDYIWRVKANRRNPA